MAMASTSGRTATDMKVAGSIVLSMVKVQISSPMVMFIPETTPSERLMEKVYTNGRMAAFTKENSKKV